MWKYSSQEIYKYVQDKLILKLNLAQYCSLPSNIRKANEYLSDSRYSHHIAVKPPHKRLIDPYAKRANWKVINIQINKRPKNKRDALEIGEIRQWDKILEGEEWRTGIISKIASIDNNNTKLRLKSSKGDIPLR